MECRRREEDEATFSSGDNDDARCILVGVGLCYAATFVCQKDLCTLQFVHFTL